MATAIQRPIPPSVFISYSWDDARHRKWVRSFAEKLHRDGVQVALDQWALAPGDQLPKFMETVVRENDYVLVICTPKYKAKSDMRAGGVGYEGDIMTGEVFALGKREKFIPVLRNGDWKTAAPSWLTGSYYVDLRGGRHATASYKDLLRTLHGRRAKPPPVGRPPKAIAPSGLRSIWEKFSWGGVEASP